MRYTLLLNSLIMVFCWCAALICITPAYNHFVQYADADLSLPVLTRLAIDFRIVVSGLPLAWCIVSWMIYRKNKDRPLDIQNRTLLIFLMVTLCAGLVLICL